MSETMFTRKLDEAQVRQLRGILEAKGFEFSPLDYGHFSARKGKCVIQAYESGKLVVAGKEAKSLFVDAIRQMKPSDALEIVRGGDDAATRYLRSQTEATLIERFSPAIDASLQQSGATDKWKGFVGVYNRIPGVRRLDTDLTRHVCQQAISGLFLKVAEEEKAIRSQPARRTTDLLRNVFGRP